MSKSKPEADTSQEQEDRGRALSRIFELGSTIIALASEPPSASLREQVLVSLDQYANGCGAWLKQHVESRQEGSVDVALGQQVSELLTQHARVLGQAQSLLSSASHELREFQRRGKGIMRYADYLPKSISMAMKQKG